MAIALEFGKREVVVQILRFTSIVIQDQEDETILTAEEFLGLVTSQNVAYVYTEAFLAQQ